MQLVPLGRKAQLQGLVLELVLLELVLVVPVPVLVLVQALVQVLLVSLQEQPRVEARSVRRVRSQSES